MEDMRLSIFILGTTAVGKTKLSLQLCKYLNGQIVSCDSKQLYKHANLMTAKSTPEQLKTFKHNMVDCLELQEASFNRNKFYEEIKQHTQRIWNHNKTPIFIGGTNYYIQPVLFQVENLGNIKNSTLNQQQASKQIKNQPKEQIKNQPKEQNQPQKCQNQISTLKRQQMISELKLMSKQQKYNRLKQVDPVMAQRLHKNDQNRITSFLQRFYKHNKKPSQNYKPYSNSLNNQNTILFWVRNSDKQEHKIVVQKRIKQMLTKQGILQILAVFAYLDIHYLMNSDKQNCDQKDDRQNKQENQFKQYLKTRLTASGIGQSIGYKQFYEFYFNFRKQILSDTQEIKSQFLQLVELYKKQQADYEIIYSTLQKHYQNIEKNLLNLSLLEQAQEQLIRDTWAYCKRQITWIRNRIFLKDSVLAKRFYVLDLAKVQRKNSISEDQLQDIEEIKKNYDKKDVMQRFDKKVKQKAFKIVQEIKQNGFQSSYQKYQHNLDDFKQSKPQIKLEDWKKYTCKQCQLQINGPVDWEQHIKSKRHLKRLKNLDKRSEIDKWIQYRKKKQENKKQQNPSQNINQSKD